MTDFNHLFAACFNKGFEHVSSQVKTRGGKTGDNSKTFLIFGGQLFKNEYSLYQVFNIVQDKKWHVIRDQNISM